MDGDPRSSICVQQQLNISFGMLTAYAVDFDAPVYPLPDDHYNHKA
ncbi:hypothetical protein GCM10023310_13130 [Paenibacillus vulneris]